MKEVKLKLLKKKNMCSLQQTVDGICYPNKALLKAGMLGSFSFIEKLKILTL